MDGYIAALIRGARFEQAPNTRYYATLPAFSDIYAVGDSQAECYYDLQAQLASAVLRRLRNAEELPTAFGARTPTVNDDVGDLYDVPDIPHNRHPYWCSCRYFSSFMARNIILGLHSVLLCTKKSIFRLQSFTRVVLKIIRFVPSNSSGMAENTKCSSLGYSTRIALAKRFVMLSRLMLAQKMGLCFLFALFSTPIRCKRAWR